MGGLNYISYTSWSVQIFGQMSRLCNNGCSGHVMMSNESRDEGLLRHTIKG